MEKGNQPHLDLDKRLQHPHLPTSEGFNYFKNMTIMQKTLIRIWTGLSAIVNLMGARPVPFALKKRVEDELHRLENLNLISKTTHSEWATLVIPVIKPDGNIRLVADYRVTVNKHIIPDEHPIPTIEEILSKVSGARYFSKFDIREAYMHLPVDEEASKLMTINTTLGLFNVNRLMYGVSSAPAIWQRTMESIFNGISGIQIFYDDIKLCSPDKQTHIQNLEKFFTICRENNIRLKREKCEFLTDEITYLGYKLDREGIKKTEEKIQAIVDAKPPTNLTELRSFIGFVSYYSRFIPKAADLMRPLYDLMKKNKTFQWTQNADTAFNAIKKEIVSDRVLDYYDPAKPLIVATDASPYGIGGVLSHQYPDGSERPVIFVSRSLTPSEMRYSQIDREALAIVWVVKKLFNYIYGRHFILYSDHKPLASIFNAEKGAPSLSTTRLLHYSIFLQGFDYEIRYKKHDQHFNADFCSRFLIKSNKKTTDAAEIFQLEQLNILPVTAEQIANETDEDTYLSQLKRSIQEGSRQVQQDRLGEWTIQDGCIMKGIRVVIPRKLQTKILQELHEGHFGMVKMKTLARSHVYWEGIDRDIEEYVRHCEACQKQSPMPKKEKMHAWEYPSGPWQRVHIDYAGVSPAQLMLNRELITSIDLVKSNTVLQNVIKNQARMMSYDAGKSTDLAIGSNVIYKNFSRTGEKWHQGTILKRNGNVMYDIRCFLSFKIQFYSTTDDASLFNSLMRQAKPLRGKRRVLLLLLVIGIKQDQVDL
ncbi:uncharacterized protein K02A2.6-like [Macrosteles quadrilineatus]|uniref:uncharacterized protein K02A2.6-like n=1 Tax=Macrosteles quadrilineatus TaxID=74068 RepID=UPI0023E29585|nr:uncharacterized protein K02A2.6-like [Macrosteles quadrilineatus]